MPRFTVRLEMHSTPLDEYKQIHEDMRNEGFSKEISASNGRVFALPKGEYNFEGDVSIKDVLNIVKKVAEKSGRRFEVLVTQSNFRIWYGLGELTDVADW